MTALRLAVLSTLLLAACAAAPEPPALGAELVALVRQHFYDAAAAEAWAARHAGYADSIRSRSQFAPATRELLAELRASHTGYYTADDPGYHGLLAIFRRPLQLSEVKVESIGVDVTEAGFVRAVFAGGPAAQAGIRRGDRIVAADGRPFLPIASLRGRAGRPLRLSVQRHADAAALAVEVVPRRVDPAVEWAQAQRQGARVLEVDGRKLAVMALFSGAGDDPVAILREAIAGPFAGADALVLDLRGGFGGCNPDFVTLFDHRPAQLLQTGRDGHPVRLDAQWRKPLVLLVDGGSRSGKEVVAHSVQQHRLGVLVGERTAGAVLAGRPFLLADGSLLYVAVGDVLVDGERLEGRGVQPDVPVPDRLEFAAGADPQLQRALQVAAGLVGPAH